LLPHGHGCSPPQRYLWTALPVQARGEWREGTAVHERLYAEAVRYLAGLTRSGLRVVLFADSAPAPGQEAAAVAAAKQMLHDAAVVPPPTLQVKPAELAASVGLNRSSVGLSDISRGALPYALQLAQLWGGWLAAAEAVPEATSPSRGLAARVFRQRDTCAPLLLPSPRPQPVLLIAAKDAGVEVVRAVHSASRLLLTWALRNAQVRGCTPSPVSPTQPST
jgi:hypothetical protein